MRALRRGLASMIFLVLLSGCGGPRPPLADGQAPEAMERQDEWQRALFPFQAATGLWAERWGRHVSLLAGGRIYATNGEDLRTGLMMSLLPMVTSARAHRGLRWAVIGIGSGLELGVALASSPESVDLYEPPVHLLARSGQVLARALRRPVTGVTRLSQARHLAAASHLRFESGRPVHERLRLLQAPPSAMPRYDVVVQTSALSDLSQVYRLYRTDRLSALRDMLETGGRVVLHLPLYEIRAETIHNLLRTFAEVFPYGAVMIPEELSADAILIGSNQPVRVDLERAREVFEDPALRDVVAEAALHRPADFAARVLMVDRGEILAVAADGRAYTVEIPMAPEERRLHPPTSPYGVEDENYLRVQRDFREQAGYDEGYAGTFYRPDWPFGDPCPGPSSCRFVDGLGEGDALALALAELAISELAQGRVDWARGLLERIPSVTPPVERAARVYELLGEGQLPPLPLEAMLGDHPLRASLEATVQRAITGSPAEATEALEELLSRDEVETLSEQASVVELLRAYLGCIVSSGRQERGRMEAWAAQSAAVLEAHPEVWLALSRCHLLGSDHGLAVLALERYVDLVPSAGGGPRP